MGGCDLFIGQCADDGLFYNTPLDSSKRAASRVFVEV
jgi:hypothetical protein